MTGAEISMMGAPVMALMMALVVMACEIAAHFFLLPY